MLERPIALRGKGAIDCMCRTRCPARDYCDLISTDTIIVEFPVDHYGNDLSDLYIDIRMILEEWEKGKEKDCRRKDNWVDGNPIRLFRTPFWLIEHVYKTTVV